MTSNQTFDFKTIPQEQLVDYYGLLFAASSSDGDMPREEMISIFEILDMEPLDQLHKDKVHSFLINPPTVDKSLESLAKTNDELRFSVVVGVVEVLLADDILVTEEQIFLENVCGKLNVNEEQVNAIINFVKESRRIAREGVDGNTAEQALKNAASGLSAVGVPITAVYFSGSVIGLSAAGITSGLAALGLGLGMVPGIGMAILMGTAVYCGLRWLLGDSKKNKEKAIALQKERKAQIVIKNLQDSIVAIINRICELEVKANEVIANKKAIEVLRERLMVLQKLLKSREAITCIEGQ